MVTRHPLPYAFAKAHTLLLEDDGEAPVLWAADSTPTAALAEAARVFPITRLEREAQAVPRLSRHAAPGRCAPEKNQRFRPSEIPQSIQTCGHVRIRAAERFTKSALHCVPVRHVRKSQARCLPARHGGCYRLATEPVAVLSPLRTQY